MEAHSLVLNNRETLQATGVTFVSSFDEREVILDTTQGMLHLKGEDLHITQLNLEEGKVVVQGRLDSVEYKAADRNLRSRGRNIMERLLR